MPEAEITEEQKNKIIEAVKDMEVKEGEALQAMTEGKGLLKLLTPIRAGGEEITELAYDFNALTGLEYTEAMDADANSRNMFQMSNRQALALFARAAAKQTPKADSQDIISQISVTDAMTGAQAAMLFFTASTRAGRLRISKKS